MRLLKSWAFWLAAPYALFVCAGYLDMYFVLSGYGEANAGAWMILLAVFPLLYARDVLGFDMAILESPAAMLGATAVQTLVLILIGALIDLALWLARSRR